MNEILKGTALLCTMLGLSTTALAANDIIGVGWSGNAFAIDSSNGSGTSLGATGFDRLNAMAKHPDGTLYAMVAFTSYTDLISIDPVTGTGTLVNTFSVSSLRGAAFRADGVLYAIEDLGAGLEDILYEVNITTGVATQVGGTGVAGLQGLAVSPSGVLYGWDCGSTGSNGMGLCTIDPITAQASDVNPSTVGNTDVQTLAFNAGGALYGGRYELRLIDPATDTYTFIGAGSYEVRGMEFIGSSGGPGTGYCSGDPGAGTPCPCGNDNDGSVPGSGCANGVFASGARLAGSGVASVGADTLVLSCSGLEPNNSGLYFQANNDLSPGLVWGDGLQCAGSQLKRLGVRFADGTGYSDTSGYPLPISVKAGNILAGDTKYYQCWYRNPNGSPCASDFNASNGYAVTWLP